MAETASTHTVQERLKLCSTLISLREKIEAGGPNKIQIGVLAGRRVASIRRVLLGAGAASMADELLTPKTANTRLLAELQAAQGRPEHERVAVAAYVGGIMETLSAIHYAERQLGMSGAAQQFPPELVQVVEAMLPGSGIPPDRADVAIDDFIERGTLGDEIQNELVLAATAGDDIDEAVGKHTRMLAEGYDKALAEQESLRASLLRMRGTASQEALDAAEKDYRNFLVEVFYPVDLARVRVLTAARQKAGNAYAQAGVKMIARMAELSPVTQDDAEKWAKAQEITPQAVARLRTIGYPLAQVLSDMAEFHRITAGRLDMIRIHSRGDRRANATDISAHGKVGTINLDSSFDRRTLWHELGHHLEADPVAKMAAGRFIRRRSTDGGKTHTLRSLTGGNGYQSDEKAYKGDFFHPYVGKIYSGGATEVFSMGVESFSDPETLARRVAQDHETMAFVAGFLQAPISPLAQAHTKLRATLREMRDEATDATENSLAGLIKELASTVELTPEDGIEWAGKAKWIAESYGVMLGRFEQSGYRLMAGKVRNINTKRKVAGLMVVHSDGDRFGVSAQIPGTDQAVAKAMYALYKKNGVMPIYHMMSNEEYVRKQAQA